MAVAVQVAVAVAAVPPTARKEAEEEAKGEADGGEVRRARTRDEGGGKREKGGRAMGKQAEEKRGEGRS